MSRSHNVVRSVADREFVHVYVSSSVSHIESNDGKLVGNSTLSLPVGSGSI